MIGIIDYGMGNVGSVESMINHLGYYKTKILLTLVLKPLNLGLLITR